MSWGRPGEEGVTGLACVCLNKCFCVMFIQNHCCSIMELKATSVLLLVCVTIIILTSTKVDAIPSCCLTAPQRISNHMLRSVSRYMIQERSGGCDIDALVLYIQKRRICADLKVLKLLKKLKKNHKPKKTKAKPE
uniref:Chemokine interleukin-8-like domain-containing protein n=3 Tax=Cyprinus carpio TaxID=7962 RepID=A0A8C1DNN2_CYPCA